jgi:hypothetical protein
LIDAPHQKRCGEVTDSPASVVGSPPAMSGTGGQAANLSLFKIKV